MEDSYLYAFSGNHTNFIWKENFYIKKEQIMILTYWNKVLMFLQAIFNPLRQKLWRGGRLELGLLTWISQNYIIAMKPHTELGLLNLCIQKIFFFSNFDINLLFFYEISNCIWQIIISEMRSIIFLVKEKVVKFCKLVILI